MRYSMIQLRGLDSTMPFERAPSDLADLVREMREGTVEVGSYDGAVAEVAFELVVEEAFVARMASRCNDGQPPSESSRMLLEDTPLDRDHWRLSDGSIVDLSAHRELLEKARQVERVRAACRTWATG